MSYDKDTVSLFKGTYDDIRDDIIQTMSEFRSIWTERNESKAIHELLFCILTPQSKAQVCWGAIEDMSCTDVLLNGDQQAVLEAVGNVRFKYKKTGFLIGARDRFIREGRIELLSFIEKFDTPHDARDWIVKNIKGLGYKEASHFLRNIGLGDDLAILDRHILRNLVKVNVIPEIPSSLSDRRYKEIESKMRDFSRKVKIPLSHLDIVIWFIATGSIFK